MSLVFEQIHTPGIAQLSYLLGDDSTGTAAVIDPRPDCECYLELARKNAVSITHIIETHIHADFISGARELACRLGGAAEIFVSEEGGAKYGYKRECLKDGDEFEFGDLLLTGRFTPGHTPEHMSFVAAEKGRAKTPWGIFSGDSLFVDSAGRPDLLGEDETEELAKQLFDTMRSFYAKLDDSVTLYPGHGAGSSCGPDIGDRKSSTLGYEKRFNKFLQIKDRRKFIEHALETAPPEPSYYRPMKKVNAKGPATFGSLPPVPALPAQEFRKALANKRNVLLDTRSMLSFGGGHIKGALNIGDRPELSPWAGWMLKFDDPLLLVLEKDSDLESVVRLLWRTGFTKFAGYLVGSMKGWDNAGFDLEEMEQMTVHDLRKDGKGIQLLDVRSPAEWSKGHIPGAQHHFVPDLQKDLPRLDPKKPTVTYCDSGYRASIAASLLQKEGFEKVFNIPGSWQAWTKAGFPIEGKNEEDGE